MTIIEPNLHGINLAKGAHTSRSSGMCAMELASFLAGEPHSDHPECVSGALTNFMIDLNDKWDDAQRQKLKPFIPRLIGTRDDGLDEMRGFLASDWLIRLWTPAWLDLAGLIAEAQDLRDLAPIVDATVAAEAGPVVRRAGKKAAAACDAAWAAGIAAWADGDAAWAAGDAAGDAAWRAAGDAAWDAARTVGVAASAARHAAWDAAWAAAWAAARAVGVAGAATGDAAWTAAASAARHAARAAAWDALQPTVEMLQASALDLLDRMIDGRSATTKMKGN